MEVARQKNEVPLPLIPEDRYGVLLPPNRFCLTNKNYEVLPSKKGTAKRSAGPWVPFAIQSNEAIKGAQYAKRARLQRKLAEQGDEAVRDTGPTDIGGQLAAKTTASDDDDDYD